MTNLAYRIPQNLWMFEDGSTNLKTRGCSHADPPPGNSTNMHYIYVYVLYICKIICTGTIEIIIIDNGYPHVTTIFTLHYACSGSSGQI